MSSQFPLIDSTGGRPSPRLQRDFAATSPTHQQGLDQMTIKQQQSQDPALLGLSIPSSSASPLLGSFAYSSDPSSSSARIAETGAPGRAMDSHFLGAQQQPHDPRALGFRKGYFEQLAGVGLGIGNLLAENLLSHPFIVLRRQCQVNQLTNSYHITPFTLMPAVFNLQQNQGVLCLWKGITSSFVVQGLSFATETVLADLLRLPKEVTQNADLTKVLKHMLLKCATFLVTTPFMAAALVETVQSDVASDRPGIFDSLREGLARISVDLLGPRDSSRKLPIWILVAPSVVYRLSHYLLYGITQYVTHAAVKKHVLRRHSEQRTVFDEFFPDLFAAFSAHLIADAILFPLETVLHRLYLQGTRTIIDNLDSGLSVVPVSTRYEGFGECIRAIVRGEGWMGFYKGFGALCFQYAVHYAILRITRVIFEQLEESLRQQHNPPLHRQIGGPPPPNWGSSSQSY